MLIAEFSVEHPILRGPLTTIDDLEIVWEHTYDQDGSPMRMVVWVDTDDFTVFERSVEEDETVSDYRTLAELDGRRLYRIDFSDVGEETNLYPVLLETGGVFQAVTGTPDGWWHRMQFPDRDALASVRQFCRDHGIGFDFQRLYELTTWDDSTGPVLTDPQREALIVAAEGGFLSIPRELSLEGLGEQLGISGSAASERFRRGVKALIDQTLRERPS